MTEVKAPPSWLTDLHGAVVIYAGFQAFAGISARATDLLWSELPQLRPWVDWTFGYGLLLLLVVGHVALRWRPARAVGLAFIGLCVLASVCVSQLLAKAAALPQYTVYEGDALVTLLASAAVLTGLARLAMKASRAATASP